MKPCPIRNDDTMQRFGSGFDTGHDATLGGVSHLGEGRAQRAERLGTSRHQPTFATAEAAAKSPDTWTAPPTSADTAKSKNAVPHQYLPVELLSGYR